MAKGKISKKQQEILEYIKMQILQRGFPPAVREICEAVEGISAGSPRDMRSGESEVHFFCPFSS